MAESIIRRILPTLKALKATRCCLSSESVFLIEQCLGCLAKYGFSEVDRRFVPYPVVDEPRRSVGNVRMLKDGL
ncbi:uncharacterized protein PHALS_10156 [Plasmopara halstedii]|uniref:Uncharacterized protein n=1 Tax=Plasmopara halstedii TaxID=4781 RepID=A0A0P1AFQ6_PLAHL|nr:uncharacterized protein PHALS_10156 [Plasmopara halstedii]CEG39930.1 hypothetical protein PHALS_10156 [Plasmopara halstedii]|eukprot:XP_024576299.1 hypothetical protein PHALS_10156 [Plasmopara halstedii]